MKRPSLVHNYLYSSLITILNVAMPVITYPYLARVLGPDNMGRLSIGAALANYFIVLASLGFPLYGVRAIAQARANADRLSQTASELTLLSFVASIISTLLYMVLILIIPVYRHDFKLLTIFGATIFGTTMSLDWFFQGIEEFKYIGIRNAILRVALVIAMFLFVRNSKDTIIYASLFPISMAISILLNPFLIKQHTHLRLYNISPFRHLKSAFIFLLVSFAITAYTNMDMLILGLRSTPVQAGYYTISLRLSRLVVSIAATLSTVMLPRLSELIGRDEEEFTRLTKRSFQLVLLFSLPSAIGLCVVAPDLVHLFAGSQYKAAVDSLRITAWLIPVVSISNFLQMQILMPKKLESKMLISFVIGGSIGFIITWSMVLYHGQIGAALGMLLTETAVATIQLIFSGRDQLRLFESKIVMRYIVGALICGGGALLPYFVLHIGFVRLAVSTSLGILIYMTYLLILKDDIIHALFHRRSLKQST